VEQGKLAYLKERHFEKEKEKEGRGWLNKETPVRADRHSADTLDSNVKATPEVHNYISLEIWGQLQRAFF
jgi:hypothetical protein